MNEDFNLYIQVNWEKSSSQKSTQFLLPNKIDNNDLIRLWRQEDNEEIKEMYSKLKNEYGKLLQNTSNDSANKIWELNHELWNLVLSQLNNDYLIWLNQQLSKYLQDETINNITSLRNGIRIEREKSWSFQLELLDAFLGSDLNTEQKQYLINLWYNFNKSSDWENKIIVSIINECVELGVLSNSEIMNSHGWLTTGLLLNYFEQFEWFNLIDFIETFWLPEYIYDLWLKYVRWELSGINKWLYIDVETLDDILIHKLTLRFVLIFLGVESDGRNVLHDLNLSSADWYFQFLTKDWKMNNWKYDGTSFITWMKNIRKIIPADEFQSRFWKLINLDWREHDPSKGSAENQLLMMMWNLFWRTELEKVNWIKPADKFIKKHFFDYYLKWNTWSLSQIYYVKHHGDSRSDKEWVRFRNYRNKYFESDMNIILDHIIAKNHY